VGGEKAALQRARGCAYREPAAAVAAASNGDTVLVGPGSCAGGFAIDKSITLRGAGPGLTTLRGGGPVVTVGSYGDAVEPTVMLGDVTITGGSTSSSAGQDDVALGGGVWIPPSADGGVGATVRIADSAVTGNAAAPAASVDAGADHPCSDTSDCPFAQAGGGGIDSWGDLTVERSVISDNTAASPATSDADGAGIYGQQGSLTVKDSVITRNRAIAGPAAGRFAEGAGIMFDTFFSGGCIAPAPACSAVIRDSTVSDNRSALTTNLPAFAKGALIGTGVNAGGIHIGDGIATTVLNSDIVDNTAIADNPEGEATAIDAGMLVGDSPLTMHNVRVSDNQTLNTVATSTDIGPGGSTLELDGPRDLSNIAVVNNASSETSVSGLAGDAGALAVFNFSGDPELVTLRDSVVSGNVAEADSSPARPPFRAAACSTTAS
jgi:Right handed beta helix region